MSSRAGAGRSPSPAAAILGRGRRSRRGRRRAVLRWCWHGRYLHHHNNTMHDLNDRAVGLKVLTGQGAAIDTTTPAAKLIFGIFAALAEFERELIVRLPS